MTQQTIITTDDLPVEWYTAAKEAKIVGCDIETNGLDKTIHQIATFQMYVPNKGTVMVRDLAHYPTNLVNLIQHARITKIFHHAPFDLGFLLIKYPWMNIAKVADTKVAAKLLDPNKKRYSHPITKKPSHSLLALVYYHFGFLMDKRLAVSDWFASELSQEQLDYAAKDVEYLPELLAILQKDLRCYNLIPELNKAFAILPRKVMLDAKVGGDIYGYE